MKKIFERHRRRKPRFTPLEPLDILKVMNFSELARGMSRTAFGGRALGEAVDVTVEMIRDKDCFKILTLSGAMTMAKVGLVACEMIENGMVDAIVATGALIAHGLIESAGMTHFKNPGDVSDEALYEMGYDRIYDTIEEEANLDDAAELIYKLLDRMNKDKPICSHLICEELGRYLHEKFRGRGILKSAYVRKIPVFIPAFTDSEIGLDLATYNRRQRNLGKKETRFDPFLDLERFAELVFKARKLGIFTVGGGVPRNWAQQICPFFDLVRTRHIDDEKTVQNNIRKLGFDPYVKKYSYGVRICPEPVHWGGLSGATYSEGVSWGKFVSPKEGGRFSEVLSDATIAWPIIVKAVMERLEKSS